MSSNIIGTGKVEVSSANEELIPKSPENWTNERYTFRKFSFINNNACTVEINGGKPIFLDEYRGFESGHDDEPIRSFIVVESGIEYTWIGSY